MYQIGCGAYLRYKIRCCQALEGIRFKDSDIWGIPSGMEEVRGRVAFYLKLPVYVLIWGVNYLA